MTYPMSVSKKFNLFLVFIPLLAAGPGYAQEPPKKEKKVNFSYSANPPIRKSGEKNQPSNPAVEKKSRANAVDGKKTAEPATETPDSGKSGASGVQNVSFTGNGGDLREIDSRRESDGKAENRTIAKKTREIAKNAAVYNRSPTEYYKIGIGDILFISLQNGSASSSKYYTVLDDGTIDYPLAGKMLSVAGLTADEVEELLRERINLYKDLEILVRVREHTSHKIRVTGLVEKTGVTYLQREAIPLFVIRAETIVKPEAKKAIIKRNESDRYVIDLSDPEKHGFLIYPGDIIEFTAAGAEAADGFYYIGNFVNQSGKQGFTVGMTLTQAILASGGLKVPVVKKVTVRRKNEKGFLKSRVYKLKDIRNGKAPDPVLEAGDVIESDR